jgi:integrase
VKSKLIAVNPFLGMAADIKLPKGRGEDAVISCRLFYDRSQFIFRSPKGKFIDLHNFANRHWHPALKALGIESRNPYQMRHSYITFCLDAGMDAKDVAKLVGNSPEMIYRHYAGAKRDLIAPDL